MMEALPIDLTSRFCLYKNDIHRLVEGQHFIATRKLVDSDKEQGILEEILDRSKPPVETSNSRGPLHYLLYTPFRYPPLKAGGRFHTRLERSLFYGSEARATAMAEVAYRRFLFLRHAEADFQPMHVPYTHFMARVESVRAILLTQVPFDAQRARISDPSSYAYAQGLGRAMRASGVELFTYFSARANNGVNVGLFSSEAFRANAPLPGKSDQWSLYVSRETVEFKAAPLEMRKTNPVVFRRDDFYVKGGFPVIA